MAQFFKKMEPSALKHLLRSVLFALLLPCLLAVFQSCSSPYSQSNFKLVGETIRTLSSPSSDACLSECSSQANCNSINFNEKSKKCELNKANHLSHPESMTPSYGSGWQYVNYHMRPPAYCNDKLCGGTKLCLLKNDGESYECSECKDALGMEDGGIPDSAITASKNTSSTSGRYGRLKSTNWSVQNGGDYFHIDLGKTMVITKIATQGCDWGPKQGYVYKYSFEHSTDNTTWIEYINNSTDLLIANTDGSTVVANFLQPNIKARFVQIMARDTYYELALRVELYGCSIP